MRNQTRRRLLGSIAAISASGVGYALGVDDASATVTIDEFSIPDVASDSNIHAPWLRVTGDYQYNEPDASEITLLLLAGDSNGLVAMQQFDVAGGSGTGQYTITGDLTKPSAYAPSDFQADSTTTVRVGVMCQVRNGSGTTINKTTVHDTAELTVGEDGGIVKIDGSGSWKFESEDGDGSPYQ